eukprot:364116-Amphidinium_carterae.1
MAKNTWLSDILAKFLEADGKTIKKNTQYATADNGLETDNKAAMSLHKWHNGDDNIVLNNRVTMPLLNACWQSTGHERAQPGDNRQLASHNDSRERQ